MASKHARIPGSAAARVALLAVLFASGCQRARQFQNLPSDMADCLPADTIALAGLHLDQIRQSGLYPALPAAWLAILEPLRPASYLVLASNGRDLLAVARGQFSTPPAGGVRITPQLALAGSSEAVDAATRQRSQRTSGASPLLADAGSITASPLWMVALGGRPLPLTGNLANLTTLLRLTSYVTLTADFRPGVDVAVSAYCPAADPARQLEEKIRAVVTLAKAASRDPDVTAMLESVQLRRDGAKVGVHFSSSLPALEKLLR